MLLRAIDGYEGYPITRFACRIAPHVMLRPGELRHSVWSDIDWEGAVWSIPAERMKMRRPYSVPLSREVLALLRELAVHTGPDGLMFPAFHSHRRPMCENTMNRAFRRMGFTFAQVTAHGLRTTASTLLNESGLWSPDAIERSLAHNDAKCDPGKSDGRCQASRRCSAADMPLIGFPRGARAFEVSLPRK
ncbi:tyrosine-type recombinase/integrase [Sphingopyxis sp. HXXIV]|uniref:tyrosine-type recombinase/integrase n=1 Tax=Sphingopyxis sp. HXXIV TaxID=1759075 RepID=UPI001E5C7DC8|nr:MULTISPECIES: site-specific integrase [unclassified Sphingopyxis]